MNSYLVGASLLIALVGLVHTVLGEFLIFRRLRLSGIVPTNGGELLKERHVRILWATWHAVTVLAWGLSLILWQIARQPEPDTAHRTILFAISTAALASAVLVFIGTRARHPGWIGLLAVAALTWLGLPD